LQKSSAPSVLSFERLVTVIGHAHAEMAAQASRAVNASLTLRNWLIGLHIEEYERRGVDRQQYGEKLLDRLSKSLNQKGVSRCDRRELYHYRQFYLVYPQIVETLSPQLARTLLPQTDGSNNRDSLIPKVHALVEYALAGIDNGLFVSKYLLELPKKEEMQRFIEEQLATGALGEKNSSHITSGEFGSSKRDY